MDLMQSVSQSSAPWVERKKAAWMGAKLGSLAISAVRHRGLCPPVSCLAAFALHRLPAV
jgi:hypothetical protein